MKEVSMNAFQRFFGSALGLGILMFVVLLGLFLIDYYFWYCTTKDVSSFFESNQVLLEKLVKGNYSIASVPVCSNKAIAILGAQFEQLINIKAHSYEVLALTTSYNYACTRGLLYASILAAILGFYLGQNGFATAEPRLKVLLAVLIAVSAFTGLSVKVLKHEDNIKHHVTIYNEATVLQQEIFNYVVTGCQRNLSDTVDVPVNKFVTSVNTRISALKASTFGLDTEKATDVSSFLKNM